MSKGNRWPMTEMPRDAAVFARVEQPRKSRDENPWLNGLGLNEDDLDMVQAIQNTYVVQLDDYPDSGYGFRIWMLWDYDRLWRIFDFGHTKGMFLVDPGLNPSLCDDDDGQGLPFTWRGVRKADPDTIYYNELITKGKIRINPWSSSLEGFFEFMMGNGSAGGNSDGEKCAFHAKLHLGPRIVPYSLEEAVEIWNDYSLLARAEEKVRQFLSPSDRAADLRRRDGDSETTPDGDEEDNSSLLSQNTGSEWVGEVFDNYGRSISVRFRVDKGGNLVGGRFDGDFRDAFQRQDTP